MKHHGGRGRAGGLRRRRRVLRFLQPCLLLLIRDGSRHGYAVASDLARFGFDEERLDVSLVYRALREMEASGWIRSYWETDSQGPPRRVYEITEAGAHQLDAMMDDLERVRGEIDGVLRAYHSDTPDGSAQAAAQRD